VPFEQGVRATVAWERDNPPDPLPEGQFDYAAQDAALAAYEGGG
jgi:hypothetical protein